MESRAVVLEEPTGAEDLAQRFPGVLRGVGDRGEYALGGVGRGGRRLPGRSGPVLVHEDGVGERSASVNAYHASRADWTDRRI